MSDAKKAALALAKAEAQEAQLATQVANAGLHMTDYQPSPVPFFGYVPGHEISGVLNGTHALTIAHNSLDLQDDLNFTIEGGHNFNLTIAGFDPLFHNVNSQPPAWELGLFMGVLHDVLQLTFDPSSGISNLTQAAAAETFQQHGNDVTMHIDTPSAHGTITFQNLADLVPPNQTESFSWINHVGNVSDVN